MSHPATAERVFHLQRYLTAGLLALFIAALALIAPTPSQAAPAPVVAAQAR